MRGNADCESVDVASLPVLSSICSRKLKHGNGGLLLRIEGLMKNYILETGKFTQLDWFRGVIENLSSRFLDNLGVGLLSERELNRHSRDFLSISISSFHSC